MEELARLLAIPENRVAVQTISQRILTEIDPDGLEVSAGLIEPLIDMVANSEAPTFDDSDQAGGFGGEDLMVMVVVPLVIEIVGHLIIVQGEKSIKLLKEKLRREQNPETFIKIRIGDLEATVSSRIPPSDTKQIKKLTKAIMAAIIEYLKANE